MVSTLYLAWILNILHVHRTRWRYSVPCMDAEYAKSPPDGKYSVPCMEAEYATCPPDGEYSVPCMEAEYATCPLDGE